MKKILIVEDYPQSAQLMEILIGLAVEAGDYGNNEIKIKSVFTLEETLQELSATIYDLIILDLGLPDEKGIAVVRKVRNITKTPIIIYTGRFVDDPKEQYAEFDIEGFYEKGSSDFVKLRPHIQKILLR